MTIEDVKEKFAQALLRMENVVGVGIGKRDNKKVIKVFVKRKLPLGDLPAETVIPTRLEGYEVDVEETGQITAQLQRGKSDGS